jgi:hypothetical protein
MEEVIEYLNLPRYELVTLFGVDWQDAGKGLDDKLTVEERTTLIPFIKRRIGNIQSLQDQVIADLGERKTLGLERYGTLLFPHNGRDMLQDLYEELLDACCYIKGVMAERDNPQPLRIDKADSVYKDQESS